MKFTLSWLKDHLETDKSVDELATTLSAIGLEVEGVEDPAKALGPFKIARIVEAKKHPNADKLQVVQVEVAKGQPLMEIVCGAPNARAGMVSVARMASSHSARTSGKSSALMFAVFSKVRDANMRPGIVPL